MVSSGYVHVWVLHSRDIVESVAKLPFGEGVCTHPRWNTWPYWHVKTTEYYFSFFGGHRWFWVETNPSGIGQRLLLVIRHLAWVLVKREWWYGRWIPHPCALCAGACEKGLEDVLWGEMKPRGGKEVLLGLWEMLHLVSHFFFAWEGIGKWGEGQPNPNATANFTDKYLTVHFAIGCLVCFNFEPLPTFLSLAGDVQRRRYKKGCIKLCFVSLSYRDSLIREQRICI